MSLGCQSSVSHFLFWKVTESPVGLTPQLSNRSDKSNGLVKFVCPAPLSYLQENDNLIPVCALVHEQVQMFLGAHLQDGRHQAGVHEHGHIPELVFGVVRREAEEVASAQRGVKQDHTKISNDLGGQKNPAGFFFYYLQRREEFCRD